MGKRWTSNFCSKWTVVLLIFPKLTPLFSGPIRAELDRYTDLIWSSMSIKAVLARTFGLTKP